MPTPGDAAATTHHLGPLQDLVAEPPPSLSRAPTTIGPFLLSHSSFGPSLVLPSLPPSFVLSLSPQDDLSDNLTTFNQTWDDHHHHHHASERPLWASANWWGLVALLVVLLTVFGNILLILAISWDRRLQNMTNYFLLSLAVTDLMVASLVMPLAIVVLILGHFPFSSELCLLWISLDVLFCTASIMHLCTLSVDRFLSLRYPMKFGRHKTRRRVVLKIVLVWCLSLAASLPLSLMYATDPHSTIVGGVCQIPVSLFQIIGSVICFYIPLVIMLVTYALTLHLLSKKQLELHAGVSECYSASPSPRSLRWKKLLCKTTSSLSTSTAVSLVSEGGGMEGRCEEGKLRRFGSSPHRRHPLVRYPTHHYRGTMKGDSPRRGFRNDDMGRRRRPVSPLSTNSHELTVLKERSHSAPTSPRPRSKSPEVMPCPHRHVTIVKEEQVITPADINALGDEPRRQEDGGSEEAYREEPEREGNDGREEEEAVAIPCSCAPRFFVEDMKTSGEDECGECSEGQTTHDDTTTCYHTSNNHIRHTSSCSEKRSRWRRWRTEDGGWRDEEEDKGCFCVGFFASLKCSSGGGGDLSSPWHETSPPPRQMVARTSNLRSGSDVTMVLRKPSSFDLHSVESSPSSARSLWRQQSCSASLKYVSSKRHGRNIRMEQKATKVLGVVFFTFVLLWAPFFITNVLLSCGIPIGEEVINLVTWLGYISSMVNPFFYTFFNKTFRQTFLKIIKCQMRRDRKYHI